MLREDILDFLRQLQSMGMLTETLRLQSEEASLCILIAGLRLHFHGASQLFSGYFDKFREMNPAKDADQEIEFFTTPPASKSYGKVLLRNSDPADIKHSSGTYESGRKLREILLYSGNL